MKKVTLPDVLNKAIDGAMARLRVMMPGRIESYNADTQRATVTPLIMDLVEAENGELVEIQLKPLTDVPVVFPGSGGVRIKFPIRAGHGCELVFASSSIARWKFSNGDRPVNPGDQRHHSLPDVVAHPGLQAQAEDASTMIEFTDSEILAGGNTALVTKDEFNAHFHPVATTGTAAAQTGTAAPVVTPAIGTLKLRG